MNKSEPGIAQYVQALLPLDGVRPLCRLPIRQNLTRPRKLRRLSRWWIEWPLVHAFARCLRRKAMNRRSRGVAGVVTKLRHVFPWLAQPRIGRAPAAAACKRQRRRVAGRISRPCMGRCRRACHAPLHGRWHRLRLHPAVLPAALERK